MVMSRTLLLSVFIAFVSACGGGGGSDNADDAGGGPGTGPTTSGLIPAAPSQGAILFADATTLRPLRDGAVYSYLGSSQDSSSPAAPTVYSTRTTQSASGTRFQESGSNLDNTGASATFVGAAGGIVSSSELVNFTGMDENVNVVELRSPVRVGDQYVSLDRHYATASDIDGDGKPDALDVAQYSRVVGQQSLSLPNLPPLAVVVEIDTVIALRVRASSTGELSPVLQGTQKVWYAPGIGVVQRTTDVPGATIDARVTTSEQITYWDGLTEGMGALPTTAAAIPFSSPTLPGYALGRLFGAFAFDDHALVATGLTNDVYIGSVISRLDLRGNVVSAQAYPALAHDQFTHMATNSAGLFHIEALLDQPAQATLTRFDPSGVLIGPAGGTNIDLTGGRGSATLEQFSASADGDVLWMLWHRFYKLTPSSGMLSEIVLRAFDSQGTPTTPEILLESGRPAGEVFANSVSARGGSALASWSGVVVSVGYSSRYAVVANGATTATPRELASGTLVFDARPVPLLLDSGGVIAWFESFYTFGPLSSTAGVLLDATYNAQRSTSGSVDSELLAAARFTVPPSAVHQHLIFTSVLAGAQLPGSTFPDTTTVSDFLAGPTPLASTTPHVTKVAANAVGQVAFADRLILFGGTSNLSTTVVWLR